jgi:hypothetical protein
MVGAKGCFADLRASLAWCCPSYPTARVANPPRSNTNERPWPRSAFYGYLSRLPRLPHNTHRTCCTVRRLLAGQTGALCGLFSADRPAWRPTMAASTATGSVRAALPQLSGVVSVSNRRELLPAVTPLYVRSGRGKRRGGRRSRRRFPSRLSLSPLSPGCP